MKWELECFFTMLTHCLVVEDGITLVGCRFVHERPVSCMTLNGCDVGETGDDRNTGQKL